MAADPIRTALYSKLSGDGGLATLVAGRVYHGVAPQEATYPLCTFHKQSGTPSHAFGGDPMLSALWTAKGISRGTSATPAEEIAARILAALDGASLAVTGRDVLLRPMWDDEVAYPEVTGGVTYHHAGHIFRIVTE